MYGMLVDLEMSLKSTSMSSVVIGPRAGVEICSVNRALAGLNA